MSNATGTIEDLRKVIALSDQTDEQLKWILDHGYFTEHEDGELIIKTGEPIDEMWFVISGRSHFYMNINGKLVFYFTFENEKLTGGVGGLLPYSRMKVAPGHNYAVGPVKVFRMHKQHFRDLENVNPDLIQRLVGYMTERARHFATQKLPQEKVNALGQLAAGIAHELNNPASAINRISAELVKRLMQNYELTEKLLDDKIKPEFIRAVKNMAEEKKDVITKKTSMSAMQRIEREDEITGWLESHGCTAKQVAETFTDTGITIEDLDAIFKKVNSDALSDVLSWLENRLSAQRILKDLDDASCRISNLVGAIKSHVHMDRTNERQPTNVHRDLENTLTLLGYKLRDKNITVNKSFCSDLREVPAFIGELTQVWTNIIDNAIYAMDKDGELTVDTKCDDKQVTVSIIDNGKGIPAEIVSRIFDPFFTTKKVGDGTGIGLDLAMRIIKRHSGEIKVSSVPGKTEFKVCLPYSLSDTQGADVQS